MKNLYSSLFFLFIVSISAQEILWQKNIKSSTQDILAPIAITLDRQYLISGSSIQKPEPTAVSSGNGKTQNNGYDFHLIKLDQNGELIWEKFLVGQDHDFLTSTISTQEGGFLLSGTTFSSSGVDKVGISLGDSDIWLVKLNENGSEEWQRTLGTPNAEISKTVIQSADLNYFVSGTINDNGYGSKDVWIIKLDKKGNPLNEILIGGNEADELETMIPTADDGVLLGIYSRSGVISEKTISQKSSNFKSTIDAYNKENLNTDTKDSTTNKLQASTIEILSHKFPIQNIVKTTENYGEGDYWIVKLDKDGKMEWQKNYGGMEDDHIRTLAATGSGFIIGGESRSKNSGNKNSGLEEGSDIWLIALDKNGNDIFQKSYSFKNRDVLMSMSAIFNGAGTEAKGFLLGGYTHAEGEIDKNDETFWMLYVNEKGEELWRKYIDGNSREKEEKLVSATMLNDGSYILAGTSAKEPGKENWKIVKLADNKVQNLIEKQDIKIYPNPVDDYCYVEIGFDFGEAKLELYDMGGRLVISTKTKNKVTKLNTNGLPQGVYLVVATTEIKKVNAKIIKK